MRITGIDETYRYLMASGHSKPAQNEHSTRRATQSGWYQEGPRMGAHGIRPIGILYQKPSTSTSTSTTTGFVNGPGVFIPPRPT